MSRTHAPCPGVAVLFLLRARARAPSFFQNALCDVSAHGTAARCPACLLHHDHPSQSQSPYPCCDVACRQGEALRGDQRTSLLKLKDQAALFFRMTLPKAKSHRRISSRFPTLPRHHIVFHKPPLTRGRESLQHSSGILSNPSISPSWFATVGGDVRASTHDQSVEHVSDAVPLRSQTIPPFEHTCDAE